MVIDEIQQAAPCWVVNKGNHNLLVGSLSSDKDLKPINITVE